MVAGTWAKFKGVGWGPSSTHAHGCVGTHTLPCVGLPVAMGNRKVNANSAIGNMNVDANTAVGTKLSGV